MEDINRIKLVLVEKKRTSKWLSEQLGVTPSTVSKWCTNSSQPDLSNLLKIAELLEVDIKELLVSEYKKNYLLPRDANKEISQGLWNKNQPENKKFVISLPFKQIIKNNYHGY